MVPRICLRWWTKRKRNWTWQRSVGGLGLQTLFIPRIPYYVHHLHSSPPPPPPPPNRRHRPRPLCSPSYTKVCSVFLSPPLMSTYSSSHAIIVSQNKLECFCWVLPWYRIALRLRSWYFAVPKCMMSLFSGNLCLSICC